MGLKQRLDRLEQALEDTPATATGLAWPPKGRESVLAWYRKCLEFFRAGRIVKDNIDYLHYRPGEWAGLDITLDRCLKVLYQVEKGLLQLGYPIPDSAGAWVALLEQLISEGSLIVFTGERERKFWADFSCAELEELAAGRTDGPAYRKFCELGGLAALEEWERENFG